MENAGAAGQRLEQGGEDPEANYSSCFRGISKGLGRVAAGTFRRTLVITDRQQSVLSLFPQPLLCVRYLLRWYGDTWAGFGR